MNLHDQLHTVAMMALCGGAMGVMFDCYRVVAGYARMQRWLYPIFDLFYWAAALALVFPTLLAVNHGDVRVYVLLSIMLGISAYFALISHWTIRGLRVFIRITETVVSWLMRLFDVFIIRPLKLLRRMVVLLGSGLAAVAVFIGKIVLQCIRLLWSLVKWITRPLHRYFAFVPRSLKAVADVLKRLRLRK